MAEKTTLVVTATPNPAEMPAVQAYLKGVMPLLMDAGGTPIKRLKVANTIHGEPSGMVLVMDFDSEEAVTEMFESDAYASRVPVRDQGFSEMNIQLTQAM